MLLTNQSCFLISMHTNVFIIDCIDRFVTHDRRLVFCIGHPYIIYYINSYTTNIHYFNQKYQ